MRGVQQVLVGVRCLANLKLAVRVGPFMCGRGTDCCHCCHCFSVHADRDVF